MSKSKKSQITATAEQAMRLGADAFVSFIDAVHFSGIPVVTVSWSLFKAYYATTVEYRNELAVEFLQVFEDHSEDLAPALLKTHTAQNYFVKTLREYLLTSNQDKRKILKNVYVGSVKSQEEFPLERLIAITSQLVQHDIKVFSDVDENRTDANYRIYDGKATKEQMMHIQNLISLGLLMNPDVARLAGDGFNEQFVIITPFGKLYKSYLEAND